MKALVFERFGGPDVLHYQDIPNPSIGPTDVLVRTKAIGLNFADVYRRKGNYHLTGTPPYILGYEGAGMVEEVGAKVSHVNVGDRIAFADVPLQMQSLLPCHKIKSLPYLTIFRLMLLLLCFCKG